MLALLELSFVIMTKFLVSAWFCFCDQYPFVLRDLLHCLFLTHRVFVVAQRSWVYFSENSKQAVWINSRSSTPLLYLDKKNNRDDMVWNAIKTNVISVGYLSFSLSAPCSSLICTRLVMDAGLVMITLCSNL